MGENNKVGKVSYNNKCSSVYPEFETPEDNALKIVCLERLIAYEIYLRVEISAFFFFFF